MQKAYPHIEKSSTILNGMSHKPNKTKQNKTKQKVLNVTCENQIHVCKLKLLWCNLQNKTDICDTFTGEHGRQKQLNISSLFSLESIDWCSVIKPQITIANDYFGGEQI
jgi:hypothetical protein